MMREIDENDLKFDNRDVDSNENFNRGDAESSPSSNVTIKITVDDDAENVSNSERKEIVPELSPTNANVDSLLNELNGLLQEDDEQQINSNSNADSTSSASNNHCTTSNGVRSDFGTAGGETNVDKMSKFYDKFSQQCFEIEKLEKLVQHLQDQCSSAIRDKDVYLSQIRDLNKNHSSKIQELEKRINDGETQTKIIKDRSMAQENHLRKTLHDQETKFNAHIEQLKKSTDAAHREKDNAVVKYAQREKEILTLESNQRKSQQQISQLTTERDALSSRLRASKNEKEQIVQVLQQKETEIADWKRKYDDIKNFIQEAEIRMKMADKKVEDVENTHKETRLELEKTIKKLREAKEENLTIKSNCQDMIKQYQETEEKKRVEVEIQKQEHNDQEEIYKKVLDEMDALKKQHKATLIEFEQKAEKYSHAERNLTEKENKISELQIVVDSRQNEIERLQKEILEYKTKNEELETEKRNLLEQERKINDLICENLEIENEAVACRRNAESMLDLTQKLSDKNSQLQSENSSLTSKLSIAERENEKLSPLCEQLKSQITFFEHELSSIKASTSGEIEALNAKLIKADQQERELNTLLDDERNQCRIIKKKHAAGLKELKSEVSLLKRRLESYESGTASQCSGGSAGDDVEHLCSRSPSMTSLDIAAGGVAANSGVRTSAGVESPNDSHSVHSQHSGVNCEHNQVMIEKIVKLQRMLARRTEKIEFLEEHSKQMVAEMQKKSRIIQSYALREETGALTPESVDINKLLDYTDQAQMAKKGQTVMGSVFGGGHSTGDYTNLTITNELSVQIMRKLQAVLEDALLKNITLKDNVDTLGNEIAKISRENRTLNLKLQKQPAQNS